MLFFSLPESNKEKTLRMNLPLFFIGVFFWALLSFDMMMIHKKRSGINERTIRACEHLRAYQLLQSRISGVAFFSIEYGICPHPWQGSRLTDVLRCLDGLRLMHSYLLKCLHRLFFFHFLLLLLLLLDVASTVIKSS